MGSVEVGIGERVRMARIDSGLSQAQVAGAMKASGINWSQATVWSVEKGERPLRLSEAAALTGVIGGTLDGYAGDDTDHLLANPSNARRLNAAIRSLESIRADWVGDS